MQELVAVDVHPDCGQVDRQVYRWRACFCGPIVRTKPAKVKAKAKEESARIDLPPTSISLALRGATRKSFITERPKWPIFTYRAGELLASFKSSKIKLELILSCGAVCGVC